MALALSRELDPSFCEGGRRPVTRRNCAAAPEFKAVSPSVALVKFPRAAARACWMGAAPADALYVARAPTARLSALRPCEIEKLAGMGMPVGFREGRRAAGLPAAPGGHKLLRPAAQAFWFRLGARAPIAREGADVWPPLIKAMLVQNWTVNIHSQPFCNKDRN